MTAGARASGAPAAGSFSAAPDPDAAAPAATVILLRDGCGGLEILAIRRALTMGFAGGAVAFPGGRVDPADRPGPATHGFAALDPADAAARLAAAREAFEEVGILLSSGPAPAPAERLSLRAAAEARRTGFADLLHGLGHALDAARLVPFARWLPPPGLHRRYDTRFYLAAADGSETHAADGHEAVHARWARPAELLAEADAGAISLLFPTRCNLARLAGCRTAAAALADPLPPPFIQPQVTADGWLTIPEGIGYPFTRERLDRVRRG